MGIGPGNARIGVVPGNYTANGLCEYIRQRMEILFPGEETAVTYSPVTLRVTISKNVAFTVLGSTNPGTMVNMLGFTQDTPEDVEVYADKALRVSGTPYISVRSMKLVEPVLNKTLYRNESLTLSAWTIPVVGKPGDIITHKSIMPLRYGYPVSFNTNDILDFSLYDESGTLMDLNGLDWSIQLIFIRE
jgi:hypothetical protein